MGLHDTTERSFNAISALCVAVEKARFNAHLKRLQGHRRQPIARSGKFVRRAFSRRVLYILCLLQISSNFALARSLSANQGREIAQNRNIDPRDSVVKDLTATVETSVTSQKMARRL